MRQNCISVNTYDMYAWDCSLGLYHADLLIHFSNSQRVMKLMKRANPNCASQTLILALCHYARQVLNSLEVSNAGARHRSLFTFKNNLKQCHLLVRCFLSNGIDTHSGSAQIATQLQGGWILLLTIIAHPCTSTRKTEPAIDLGLLLYDVIQFLFNWAQIPRLIGQASGGSDVCWFSKTDPGMVTAPETKLW